MTLACAATSAACADDPVQRHRIGHAFEFVVAPLLGDEQSSHLTPHPRRDNDRTRLGQGLCSCCHVGHIAEYLACRVDDNRSQVDGDARSEGWLASDLVVAVQLGERALDRERCPHRALGVVLLRHRIAEQRHQSIAQLLGDLAAHLCDGCRGGIEIRWEVRKPDDLDRVFAAAAGSEAVLVQFLALTMTLRWQIAELAVQHLLPTIYDVRDYVAAGGLMSYGLDYRENLRCGMTYVDRILRGAQPKDLPVEQASKFELVINLKTAKALGLIIPPALLALADEVIE
jgi:ABC transporter substrate binding protein